MSEPALGPSVSKQSRSGGKTRGPSNGRETFNVDCSRALGGWGAW